MNDSDFMIWLWQQGRRNDPIGELVNHVDTFLNTYNQRRPTTMQGLYLLLVTREAPDEALDALNDAYREWSNLSQEDEAKWDRVPPSRTRMRKR